MSYKKIMNFFSAAFFIASLQINLSNCVNYIVKLIGFLFFWGGVLEVSSFNKSFEKYIRPTKMLIVINVIALALFATFYFIDETTMIRNVSGVVLGTIVTFSSLCYQKSLIKAIRDDEHLVSDVSLVKRFSQFWDKLAVVIIVNLFADILNRIVTVRLIADLSGFVMAISKIIMYVMSLILLLRINKIRVDFNKKHSV